MKAARGLGLYLPLRGSLRGGFVLGVGVTGSYPSSPLLSLVLVHCCDSCAQSAVESVWQRDVYLSLTTETLPDGERENERERERERSSLRSKCTAFYW